jgi:hypothetical protein
MIILLLNNTYKLILLMTECYSCKNKHALRTVNFSVINISCSLMDLLMVVTMQMITVFCSQTLLLSKASEGGEWFFTLLLF